VTYGSANYAGGVPVGTITKQVVGSEGLSRRAEIQPFARFGSLDLVGVVVRRPQANPGDRLLPPRPVPSTPTPAPTPVRPNPATPSAVVNSTAGTTATRSGRTVR
jgi:rod shape-determining protein MreC